MKVTHVLSSPQYIISPLRILVASNQSTPPFALSPTVLPCIWWFAFGPEPVFPGSCYSEEAIGLTPSYPGIGQNASKSELFAQMA